MSRDKSQIPTQISEAGDGFHARFLARVPPDLAASFTPEQVAAVRFAFGMRYEMAHAVDARRTFSLPWGRFYFVLLLGRDSRNEGRGGRIGTLLRLFTDTASCAAILAAVMLLGLVAANFVTELLAAPDTLTAAADTARNLATR